MTRLVRLGLLFAVIAVASACVGRWPQIRDEFFVLVGNRDEAGGWYGTWSGFAGGLQIFEWAALGALLYRHRNCHVRGCPRIGRHPVEGTPYVVCGRHSPGGVPTHQDVIDAHRRHLERAGR